LGNDTAQYAPWLFNFYHQSFIRITLLQQHLSTCSLRWPHKPNAFHLWRRNYLHCSNK